MAHDAIQAIKQLRRDVVEAMRSLMKLARDKQTSGMLPICEDMISKTRILLSLWDPGLVEEALTFLEEHKVAKIPEEDQPERGFNDSTTSSIANQSLSPFKRITQRLNFDLKTSDFDDFISPDTPECVQDLWVEGTEATNKYTSLSCDCEINSNLCINKHENFVIFPDVDDETDTTTATNQTSSKENNNEASKDDPTNEEDEDDDDDDEDDDKVRAKFDLGKRFLDTQKMCNSPSANYYKPTDEPEPWDLTQLNIEASVMCLVSKVKFLCGRCSSPAVRLRNKNSIGRSQSLKCYLVNERGNDTVPAVVTIQPKNDTIISDESSKLLLKRSNDSQTSWKQQHAASPPRSDNPITAMTKAKEGQRILRTEIFMIFQYN